MEQNKALYETLFIVRNTIGEEAVKSVIEKFTALITDNGEVEEPRHSTRRKRGTNTAPTSNSPSPLVIPSNCGREPPS